MLADISTNASFEVLETAVAALLLSSLVFLSMTRNFFQSSFS